MLTQQIQNQVLLEGKYIQLEMENRIYGKCENMISDDENWRAFQKYQQEPYQKIAKHFRNIQYNSQNTRSFSCLKKTLKYIYENFVPILQQLFKHSDQHNLMSPAQLKEVCERRNTFLTFLYDRLKAIRCQYYVQGIVYPSELIKLIRLQTVIETLHEMPLSGDGLQRMINFEDGDGTLVPTISAMQHFQEEYIEALSYSVLFINRSKLTALISNHQIITQNRYLNSMLQLRMKIDNGNYDRYFQALEKHQNPVVKYFLWSRINQMRQTVIQRVRKSKMNVQKSWIRKIMGWKIEDGWIQAGKVDQYREQSKKNIKYVLLGIRTWVHIEEICQFLMQSLQEEHDEENNFGKEQYINISQPLNTITMIQKKNEEKDIVDDQDW